MEFLPNWLVGDFLQVVKKTLKWTAWIVLSCAILLLSTILFYGGWWYFFEQGLQVSGDPSIQSIHEVLNRSVPSDFEGTSDTPETIVLVTLDTLRADQLSTYGYPKETSPNLDEFASEGVQFNRAFTSMPTTSPAHATILSSLYPVQHRVQENGHKMRTDIKTLPEYLKDKKGYTTAAFVSTNRHFGSSDVAQGIEHYDDPVRKEQLVAKSSIGSLTNLRYRPAERTVDTTLDWLDGNSPDRLFLWVHFFDPHFPYARRDKALSEVTSSSDKQTMQWIKHLRKNRHVDLLSGSNTVTEMNRKRVMAYRYYDSEIRHMDREFGRLMDHIRDERGNSILTVVAGDHGEGMGNHDYWGHGKNLYNEQIRVPMMIQFPDDRYSGREVDRVVELNDLMPTVLREVEVDTSILNDRRIPIEGTPVQRLLNGDMESFRYAFTQRRQYPGMGWWPYLRRRFQIIWNNPENHPFTLRYLPNYEMGESYSLVKDRKKYIHKTRQRDEAYDLSNDIYEQNSLLSSNDTEVQNLGSTLKSVVGVLKQSVGKGSTRSVDEETRKKLEGLGYF